MYINGWYTYYYIIFTVVKLLSVKLYPVASHAIQFSSYNTMNYALKPRVSCY